MQFTITRRRHHCRRCGRIFCGPCCDNQVFIEGLSRTGKPKRICDECFRAERGLDGTPGAAGAPAEGAGASATGQEAENPAADPSVGDPVANLEAAPAFEGDWAVRMAFTRVELAGAVVASDAHVYLPGATAAGGAANLIAPGKKKKRRSVAPNVVSVGCRRSVDCTLQKKGTGYFKGSSTSLLPFGAEGSVSGSLQRISGKVQFQLSYTNVEGVTMQLNFTGVVNKKMQVVGTFTGTEIAREAGVVAGTFSLYRPNDTTDEADELEEEAAEEAAAAAAAGETTPADKPAFLGAQAEAE